MLQEAVVIPADITIDRIITMFDAGKRALSLVNTIKDPIQKRKHLSAVFTNLNKIRAAMARLLEVDNEEG